MPWFYPLPPAKAEAIELLAEGLSNEEIARAMVRRRETIEMHIQMSRMKLNVLTRAELVDWVAKHRPRSTDSA